MGTISQLRAAIRSEKSVGTGHGGGGEPPYNGGMDRIDRLEGSVARLEADVSSLKDGLSEIKIALVKLDAKLDIGAIREGVEKAHTDIYKWVATIAISVAGLGFAIYSGLKATAPASPPISPVAQQTGPAAPALVAPSPK